MRYHSDALSKVIWYSNCKFCDYSHIRTVLLCNQTNYYIGNMDIFLAGFEKTTVPVSIRVQQTTLNKYK